MKLTETHKSMILHALGSPKPKALKTTPLDEFFRNHYIRLRSERNRMPRCEWAGSAVSDDDFEPAVQKCWLRNDGEWCDSCQNRQVVHERYAKASKLATKLKQKLFRVLRKNSAPAKPKPEVKP